MTTGREIIDFLEGFAPTRSAESWDNVGLLLGDSAQSVTRVMTCLTLTPDVAQEAVTAGAEFIVTHHPILFRPVQSLTTANPQGAMLLGLAQAGVAVFSP
ncbi:MAG: Nif3-like dinuclear metal center hexameric protein, partial [Planctomycetaceae bacterium]|nr:Nif3-like dinuclear metal center hexameric protein [Planctomycetaceae bacterium]